MAKIEFLGPIQKETIEIDITHLSELKTYFENDPEVKEWLKNSAIAVNDCLVSNLNLSISKNDKISLLPPVCGG
jgi:molybdopterin synthase sulfur carrier subunit